MISCCYRPLSLAFALNLPDCSEIDSWYRLSLLSGGLDGFISIYDLQKTVMIGENVTFKPIVLIKKYVTLHSRRRKASCHSSNFPSRLVGSIVAFSDSSPWFCVNERANHMQAPRSGVTAVAWNPQDTGLFVTGSFDQRVCVWDTNALVMVHAFRFESDIKVAKISPVHPNSLVAVGTGGGPEVSLCDLRLGETAQVLAGHSSSVTALAWSPGSEYTLVSGASDGTMKLWDLRKSNAVMTLDSHKTKDSVKKRGRSQVQRAEPNGRKQNGAVQNAAIDDFDQDLFEDAAPAPRRRAGAPARPGNPAPVVNQVRRPAEARNDDVPRFQPHVGRQYASSRPETAHQGIVTDIAFLPHGTQLLSTGADHMMRLWDAQSGLNQLVHYPEIKNHSVHTARICLSNNGAIVYHPRQNDILALEVQTGKKIHTLHGHFSHVTAFAFHKAMPELYSASSDGQILVWTPLFDESRYLDATRRTNAVVEARRNASGLNDADAEEVADWASDDEFDGM